MSLSELSRCSENQGFKFRDGCNLLETVLQIGLLRTE